nr:glycosyltransferase [uncultured Niameybacter sp.]
MKKKIVFLMYMIGNDGVTVSLLNLIEAISKNNDLDISIWSIVKSKSERKIPVEIKYLFESEKQVWEYIKNAPFLIKGLEEIDIVIAYSCIFCAEILARSLIKGKKIAWIHSDLRISGKYYSNQYIKSIYENMDEVVCVSYGVRDVLFNIMNNNYRHEKFKVIYNLINIDEILQLAAIPIDKREIENNKFVIAIGRLSLEKGFDKLIKVWKRLKEDGLDYKLIILGEGEERGNLESLIKRLNLKEECILKGYVRNPYNWIKQSELVISVSEAEGLPLNIMEAMSLCKAIVATRVMGNEELLEPELGMLVEDIEDEIYKGIKKVLSSIEIKKTYIENLKRKQPFKFEAIYVLPQIKELLEGE